MKDQFQARMLRIHFGEGDKWEGKPLHEAIVSKCLELGLKGTGQAQGSIMQAIGNFPKMRPSC